MYSYLHEHDANTIEDEIQFLAGIADNDGDTPATDDQLSTVDPKTGLRPFMLAAADNKSDLTAVYYL